MDNENGHSFTLRLYIYCTIAVNEFVFLLMHYNKSNYIIYKSIYWNITITVYSKTKTKQLYYVNYMLYIPNILVTNHEIITCNTNILHTIFLDYIFILLLIILFSLLYNDKCYYNILYYKSYEHHLRMEYYAYIHPPVSMLQGRMQTSHDSLRTCLQIIIQICTQIAGSMSEGWKQMFAVTTVYYIEYNTNALLSINCTIIQIRFLYILTLGLYDIRINLSTFFYIRKSSENNLFINLKINYQYSHNYNFVHIVNLGPLNFSGIAHFAYITRSFNRKDLLILLYQILINEFLINPSLLCNLFFIIIDRVDIIAIQYKYIILYNDYDIYIDSVYYNRHICTRIYLHIILYVVKNYNCMTNLFTMTSRPTIIMRNKRIQGRDLSSSINTEISKMENIICIHIYYFNHSQNRQSPLLEHRKNGRPK